MRALVVGGFEPSGHDARSSALVESGNARGHEIVDWRWRNKVRIDQHPVFHLHRIGIQTKSPHLAGILGAPKISTALADDLAELLSVSDADVVISTHPWSTVIAIRSISLAASKALLVDCHGDFTPSPLFTHPRIDAYVGGIIVRPLPQKFRSRVWLTGPPVRNSFCNPSQQRLERSLVVSGGKSSWFDEPMSKMVDIMSNAVTLDRVVVLASDEESAKRWSHLLDKVTADVEYLVGCDDIGPVLTHARWLLTKGSGAAIAEGLAAGCQVLCVPSGVFWEDEARAHLSAMRAVVPIDNSITARELSKLLDCTGLSSDIGNRCSGAPAAIWNLIEAGCPAQDISAQENDAIDRVIRQLAEPYSELIPQTSRALEILLAEWTQL